MPCPFHGSKESEPSLLSPTDRQDRGIDRRAFMKTALAIGGASALGTVQAHYGVPESAPDEPIGVADRLNRQHAWEAFMEFADLPGLAVPPPHHLILLLDLQSSGEPSPGHRKQVAGALRQLENAFEWSHEGVLFTVGYSPAYFDRFEESLPSGLDPDNPEDLEGGPALMHTEFTIDETAMAHEDITADTPDAIMHLASDEVATLLQAEEALWGELEEVNGVEIIDDFSDIFERPTAFPKRRTGFVGRENLLSELEDVDLDLDPEATIPAEAELSMGFNALRANSVPRETNATLLEDQQLVDPKPPGVFAQGTIQHVSKLDIDLDSWYGDLDEDERRERMWSPHHTEADVGVAGENLGNSNATTEDNPEGVVAARNVEADDDDLARRTQADAETDGVVGHVQKLARGRFNLEARLTDDIDPDDEAANIPDDRTFREFDGLQQTDTPMLRRDFNTTDDGVPGMHFIAVMRFNGYMNYVRQAMNGVEFDTADFGLDGDDRIVHDDVEVDPADNGIAEFLDVTHRGNYLVPPIELRALPAPRAIDVEIESVEIDAADDEDDAGTITVVVHSGGGNGNGPVQFDEDTVRFGHYRDVNRGGGASPASWSGGGPEQTYEFDVEETGIDLDADSVRLRLFGKTEGSKRATVGSFELEL